ncbi:MAG: hypothetical protein IJA86_08740 [Clostridia bacterium]|nr:hypothetical protein [Clostridia bacterium]
MKINETLDWILDNDDQSIDHDEKCRLNIEFVHALGLKCDCVGWSKLDLQSPRADEILFAIDSFCKENGWKARGIYTRTYEDFISDWYELVFTCFKDNAFCGCEEVESEQGKKVPIFNLRAYHELRPSPKWWYEPILVPERFRDACIRHNITDVDFCWAKDKGKYKAEQYFHLYCNQQISAIATGREMDDGDRKKIADSGGYFPKIAGIFYKIQQIHLQDCYLESDIPNGRIAHAYTPKTFSYCGRNKFLIHKSFAEILLKEKAIFPSDLRPAMIVKEVPGGYTLEKTEKQDRPVTAYLKQSISEYEELKNTERPLRTISEKEALKLFRSAKKERREDFRKALPKIRASELAETEYAPVLPYYLIADGGHFSDEYEFLAYRYAMEENVSFAEELCAEELLEEKPNGVVFAKCPDGDRILLCVDGKVLRFSHEEPVATEEWESLAQFVVDAIHE